MTMAARRTPVVPGTSEFMLRVMKRTEELMYDHWRRMQQQEEAARKPDADELREASAFMLTETDSAVFEQKLLALDARYGEDASVTSALRALRRRARDEGR